MKKEIIALVLLIALFAASLYNVHYLENMVGDISGLAAEAYDSLMSGDAGNAEQKLEQAIRMWEKEDGYTHIFIRHSEIDATSDAMFEALGCITAGEPGEAEGAFRCLFYHLDSLVGLEKMSLGSIF